MKETDLSAENFDEKLTLVLQEVDKTIHAILHKMQRQDLLGVI